MTTVVKKRLRSDESPYSTLQHKVHVNQKIIDQNDSNKMKEIHAKTVRKLFDGARQVEKNKETKNAFPKLSNQIILYGDGRIDFRQFPHELAADRQKAKCCAGRESFVQERCVCCSFEILCENCGFSCSDCGNFLCRSCVGLFGCVDPSTDRPICENCAIFN